MFIIQTVVIRNLEVKAVVHLVNSTFFNNTQKTACVKQDCFNAVCRRVTVEQKSLREAVKTGDLLQILGRKDHQDFNSP